MCRISGHESLACGQGTERAGRGVVEIGPLIASRTRSSVTGGNRRLEHHEQSGRSGDVMYILGISTFYNDSAACFPRGGEIVAAAQEERFTRKKHYAGFPKESARYCLRESGISLTDLRYIAFYEKPLVKFERLLEPHVAFVPRSGGVPARRDLLPCAARPFRPGIPASRPRAPPARRSLPAGRYRRTRDLDTVPCQRELTRALIRARSQRRKSGSGGIARSSTRT